MVIYDRGFITGKIILKFPPFCQLNEEGKNSKGNDNEVPHLKIVFPVPYPILYNPGEKKYFEGEISEE